MPGGCDKPGLGDSGAAVRGRYALPSDLPGSLRQLDDGQLESLLRAVVEEARRRGLQTGGVQDGTPASASDSRRGRLRPPEAERRKGDRYRSLRVRRG